MSDNQSLTVQDKYALTGQRVGRPTDYRPEYVQIVTDLMMRDPAPSIVEIAVELGKWPKRLYEWGHQFPEFQHTLNQAQARHELRQLKRLEGETMSVNAIFTLKAYHAKSDRPAEVNVRHSGEVKVITEVRVIDETKSMDDDAIDIEYEHVDD